MPSGIAEGIADGVGDVAAGEGVGGEGGAALRGVGQRISPAAGPPAAASGQTFRAKFGRVATANLGGPSHG